jgi:hypothetical protein
MMTLCGQVMEERERISPRMTLIKADEFHVTISV